MSEGTSAPPAAPRLRAKHLWRRNRSAGIGLAIVLLFLFAALAADLLAPYGANERHGQNLPPSAAHWLGTDSNEYDVLTRVLHGSRLSLLAGGVSILLALALGTPIGALAGYFGGRVDSLLMRGIDVVLAFPSILIAFLVVAAFRPGWTAVILAVGLINIPVIARQVRAQVLSLRGAEYLLAARALGASDGYILLRVVPPAILGPVLVLATLGLGSAILEVAGLSFLGVGGDAGQAEWGAMLNEAKDHLQATLWPALGPGLAISLAVLGFNLLGDGLRDALDPRARRR